MDLNVVTAYFVSNPKSWKSVKKLYSEKRADFSEFPLKVKKIFEKCMEEYGGWGWVGICKTDPRLNSKMEKKLTPLNVLEYADQHGFTVSWTDKQMSLKKGDVVKAVYPIKECIPLAAAGEQKKVFYDYRAALEIAAVKPGMSHVPLNQDKWEEACAHLTPENYSQAITMVKDVKNNDKKALPAAQAIYESVTSKQNSLDFAKTLHSVLVEDAVVKAQECKAENFYEEQGGFYEIKGKLVPKGLKLTQPQVQQYLNVSRTYRQEDGSGLSGISNGYSYGMIMSKNKFDVLEELDLLRTVRKLFPDRHILVYGIMHEAKLYAVTNVAGPIFYQAKLSFDYGGGHSQGMYVPSESAETVVVDYSVMNVPLNKSMTPEDKVLKFKEVYKAEIGNYKTTRIKRALYVDHIEKMQIIPTRNYHNMIVYYTNIKLGNKDRPLLDKGKLLNRMFLANFVRNNWFSSACHFVSVIRHAEGEKDNPYDYTLFPSYKEAKKVVKEFSMEAISVDHYAFQDKVSVADAAVSHKKKFQAVPLVIVAEESGGLDVEVESSENNDKPFPKKKVKVKQKFEGVDKGKEKELKEESDSDSDEELPVSYSNLDF